MSKKSRDKGSAPLYAALFVRVDSSYKQRNNCDAWDIDRDALNFQGSCPVVCHPPCRAWGQLSHMATPREGEAELSLWAIDTIRKNGGILEHPSGSRLFKKHLPDANQFPDDHGGFTISIDQYDFGHVAHKPTKLYFCGIKGNQLPQLPLMQDLERGPLRSMTGQVPGTLRATQYEREYTPDLLIDYFESVLKIITNNKGF